MKKIKRTFSIIIIIIYYIYINNHNNKLCQNCSKLSESIVNIGCWNVENYVESM